MSLSDVLERPKGKAAKGKAAKDGAPQGMIEVQAGALAKAMRQMDRLVERKNTVPMLGMVRIDASRDGLKLLATDLDIWASDSVEALGDVGEIVRFSTCVSARKLFEAVDMLPSIAVVRLTQDGQRLRVNAESLFGPVEYRFPTLGSEEFPLAPPVNALAEFAMPVFALATAIDAVRHAMSAEETRYYLNGIFMHVVDGALLLAATDGHRLARHRSLLPEGAEGMPDSIIHRKTVGLISELLDRLEGREADEADVEICAAADRMKLTIGTCELVAKLVDGTFPEYSRVIPTRNEKVVTVRPGYMAGAIKQVRLLGSEKTRAVKLALSSKGGGQMQVLFSSPENGDASASLRCDYSGDDLTIGFNASYLLGILDRMGGEECTLQLGTESDPAMIVNYEGASSDYVLMPMRV